MAFLHIAKYILRYRVAVLVVVGAISALMLLSARKLNFYYRPTPLLPQEDSFLVKNNQYADLFGKGENIMVFGVQDSNFFELERFIQWQNLEDSLLTIKGVEYVFSVSDAINLRKDTDNKQFVFEKVIASKPKSQKDLDSLAVKLKTLPFYKGLLYNEAKSVYLMAIAFNHKKLESEERIQLIQQVVAKCEAYSGAINSAPRFSGLPYVRTTIAEMIKKEMFLFIGLAVFVTFLIIFFLFRSWRIVLISQLVVGVSVIWALGFMAMLDYEITLLTAVIPPLVIVIGIPNCVFLLNKFHNEYSRHGNKIKALFRSIHNIGSAIFLTNLTTAAGFGTFTVTHIRILNEFGLAAAIGVLGVFVVSLLLIPTIFSFLPEPKPKHLSHLEKTWINNTLTRVMNTVLHHRRFVIVFAFLIILIGFWGLSRIKSNGFMVDDIPHNHPVYQDLKFFEENFSGVMPLDIIVDTKQPKGVLQEAQLRKLNQLQDELSDFPELSKPLSIVEAAKFTRQAYFNGNAAYYKLPVGPERAFILSYLPKNMANNDFLGRFIDSSGRYTKIMYNSADIGTIKMKELQTNITSKIDSIFGSDRSSVHIGGWSIIATKGNDYLVNGLFISLIFAVGLISLFMAWMFRNPRMVLLSVLPNLIPLLITSAIMGFVGINLKPSTVIVFSIAFGIAVDNSIHFLSRFRREHSRTKGNTKASVVCAIRETGFSMIYTSIVLLFGFGIFIASRFGGTISLGILVSTTLFIALFCNLILLPSVLLSMTKGNNFEDRERFSE